MPCRQKIDRSTQLSRGCSSAPSPTSQRWPHLARPTLWSRWRKLCLRASRRPGPMAPTAFGSSRRTARWGGLPAAIGRRSPFRCRSTKPTNSGRHSAVTRDDRLPRVIQGGPKNWHPLFVLYGFCYALISSNIDRFSSLFHCLNRENIL